MREEITATVTLTFDCPADADLADQQSMIAEDVGRLNDADSTTGVACTSFRIETVSPEAQTYSKSTSHMICATCGSENVRADAFASWDSTIGDWVLHSVYDEKYCEACDSNTQLLEVDEATELEVQAFGMISTNEGARLVKEDETPEFFDLIVKTIPDTDAEVIADILTLHEFDDMTLPEVEKCLADMAMLYPLAPSECHFGRAYK